MAKTTKPGRLDAVVHFWAFLAQPPSPFGFLPLFIPLFVAKQPIKLYILIRLLTDLFLGCAVITNLMIATIYMGVRDETVGDKSPLLAVSFIAGMFSCMRWKWRNKHLFKIKKLYRLSVSSPKRRRAQREVD